MNKPISSIGATLKYGATASPTTRLYSLLSIPEMGGARESIDVTTLADDARVFAPGVRANDALEFTGFKGFYGADGTVDEYAALRALSPTAAQYWEITWPDGSKDSWQGYPDCRSSGQEVNGAPTYILNIIPATSLNFTPAPSGT
jgi:hypothetical protein